jgi:hypothetical protein
MTSAYPVELTTLTDQVRARAVELGALPSRNRIKTEFRVGATKARAALDALAAEGFDPSPRDPAGQDAPRRLHSVDTTGPDPDPAGDAPPDQAGPGAVDAPAVVDPAPQISLAVDPGPADRPASDGSRHVRVWPLLLLAAGAFVAIWSGWVGLGQMTGFGPIHPLPGIADRFVLNTAITLPIGVEAYAAFALRVWLATTLPTRARRFARTSALAALGLGAAGQVTYHLMTAAHVTEAPWPITTAVSCLPVIVLGCGAALAHLLRTDHDAKEATQ